MKINDTYFETLGAALAVATAHALKKGFEVDSNDLFQYFCIGGVSYNQTKRGSIGLTKDGKQQKKCLQISIYRFHTGRYELTHYIN